MMNETDYYYQKPRDDKRTLLIMAGLGVIIVVLAIIIALVVVHNNTSLNPTPPKNLTVPEKTLREAASTAFANLQITTTPRQIFLEKIDFENEWIFLKVIAANISPTNPSRTLYAMFKKGKQNKLQLIAHSSGREAWRTTGNNTLPDDMRERARKLWDGN